MAVPFRTAVTSRFVDTTGSLAIPANTVQSGDGMLIVVSWDNTATLTTPSGWTQQDTDRTVGTRTSRLLARIAASSSGSTVTFTLSAVSTVDIAFVAYAGVYANLAAFIDDVQGANDGSASTLHAAPAATFNGAGEFGVAIWTERSTTNTSWTPPSGTAARVIDLGSGGGAFSTLIVDNGGGGIIPPPPSRLAQPRFNKPSLTSPSTVNIADGTSGQYAVSTLSAGDKNVTLAKSRTAGAAFGNSSTHDNTVTVGSTMTLTNPGPLTGSGLWDPNHTSDYRRGFYINAGSSNTAKVDWVGGIYGKGTTLSEGIQTNTAHEVRVAHCRFDYLVVQDEVNQVDNHPDIVQCMRADGGVQISWCCAVTDMQGFMAKHETSLGASAYPFYNLDNCLVHGGDNGLILLNIVDRTTTNYRFENVCIIPSQRKINQYGLMGALDQSVIPNGADATWPLVLTTNADGTVSFTWPAAGSQITQVGQGVYYDPAIAAMVDNTASGAARYKPALEYWLPAALIGDNYNASLYT